MEKDIFLVAHDDKSYGHPGKCLLVEGFMIPDLPGVLEVVTILEIYDDVDDFRPVAIERGWKEGTDFIYYEL